MPYQSGEAFHEENAEISEISSSFIGLPSRNRYIPPHLICFNYITWRRIFQPCLMQEKSTCPRCLRFIQSIIDYRCFLLLCCEMTELYLTSHFPAYSESLALILPNDSVSRTKSKSLLSMRCNTFAASLSVSSADQMHGNIPRNTSEVLSSPFSLYIINFIACSAAFSRWEWNCQ